MPRLPLSPNLEHLKEQAKELLKARRSGKPGAQGRFQAQGVRTETFRLADAQWVVAREYGFPDWTRLKRFVSVRVRRSAVPVLETYCKDVRAVRALRELALDADAAISRNAKQALGRLGEG